MRFIWTQDLFKWLILLTFVGMFFANSYIQIMPVFADLLDSGETGFGYLLSAGGVGSVLGTLLMGGVHKYARLGLVMLGAAALSVATVTMAPVTRYLINALRMARPWTWSLTQIGMTNVPITHV